MCLATVTFISSVFTDFRSADHEAKCDNWSSKASHSRLPDLELLSEPMITFQVSAFVLLCCTLGSHARAANALYSCNKISIL